MGAPKHEWLPDASDREYLLSIMDRPVYEPGKFANYIAPPLRGINRQPVNFEYVRTEAINNAVSMFNVQCSMQHNLLINNEWRAAAAGQTMDVVNPATEDVIAQVPSAVGGGSRSGGRCGTCGARGPVGANVRARARDDSFANWGKGCSSVPTRWRASRRCITVSRSASHGNIEIPAAAECFEFLRRLV